MDRCGKGKTACRVRYRKCSSIVLALICVFFIIGGRAAAQSPTFNTDTTRGSMYFDIDSVGLYGEKYNNADTVVGERPPQTGRIYLRGSGKLWDIETVADVFVSTEFTDDRQDMNRMSLDGRYKWIQFSLGDHYPNYGTFSLSGVRTRGLGLIFTPGTFMFQFNVGQSQGAVEGDSILYRPGMYRRWMYAGRMGYEDYQWNMHLSLIKAKDETGSIKRPFGSTPQENLMGGWDLGFHVMDIVYSQSQLVFSAHTRDLESSTIVIEEFPGFLKGMITPHTSTSFEYSFRQDLRAYFTDWNASAYYSRVNSGFSSLGAGYLLNDWQEYRLDTRMNLMDRKINLGFFFGQRNNNLANDRLITTKQTTGGTTVIVRPAEYFYVNTNYSVLLETNDADVDTVRKDNLSHTLIVQPVLDFFGDVEVHHVDVIASVQTLSDRTPRSIGIFDFTTLNLGVNYMYSLPYPLTVVAGYNIITSKTVLETSTRHLSSGRISWDMFRNRLSNTFNVTYTRAFSDVERVLDNNRWDFVLNVTYRLTQAENIHLDLRQTIYNDTIGKSFREFVGFLRYMRGF